MHVARLATDERLVNLNLAGQLYAIVQLKAKANAMQHEPCGLLGDAHGAVNLPGRDAVLHRSNHPNNREPLVEANWRILKNRADFDGELLLVVLAFALPTALIGEVANILRSTGGAHDAIRPALRSEVVLAVVQIGEVYDRFLE